MVDAPLDYNFLLGRNWFYSMTTFALSIFHTLQFPHQGKIVTIDQLDYFSPDISASMTNNVPMLGQSPPPYTSVRVGLLKYSSHMGVFPSNISPPTTETSTVNMISSTIRGMSKAK